MRICILLVGLFAASISVAQGAETRAVLTRVHNGGDYESYYLDPPSWSYHPKRSGRSKNAHWLYKNHRQVFIDIKISDAGSR
jgi:hypothetical protein